MFGDIKLSGIRAKNELRHSLAMSTAGPKGRRELSQAVKYDGHEWVHRYIVRHEKARPKETEFNTLAHAVLCYNEGR